MLSKRVRRVQPSKTMEFSAKAKEMKEQGISIMDFSAGEPDFDTPEFVREAAVKAMEAGHTRYTAVPGIVEFRTAIAEKLWKDNHMHYTPDEICIGVGAKQPIFSALLAVCEEGDEVILPVPCWVSYEEMLHLTGAKPVHVPCKEETGFQLDIDAIRAAVSPRTKAILINSPNNPTGAVYTRESLEELVKLAIEYEFYIISDEVYEKLIFEDTPHVSPGEICDEAKKWCIIVNGMSKAYAMTGWRIGYAAADAEVTAAIKAIQSHATGSANSITQYAAMAALYGDPSCIEVMRIEYAKRREYLIKRLETMKYITCKPGEGAFYLMFNVSNVIGKTYQGTIITSSGMLAELLLTKAHVCMMDGDAFFAPGYLRMCYASSMEMIREGMDRLEAFLEELE